MTCRDCKLYNLDATKDKAGRRSTMSEETKEVHSERHGIITAFLPEYRIGDGEWMCVPWKMVGDRHPKSIPFPLACGGALQESGMCGYEQAMALAWRFAADYKAEEFGKIEVRAAAYEVRFDITAWKLDEGPQ